MTNETEIKMKVGLRKYQRRILPMIISSMIITTLVLSMAFFDKLPWTVAIDLSLENRLIFTLQLLFIDLFPLLMAIFGVINIRASSIAINPMDPRGHALVEQRQRILQNTLEQSIIKLILSLALCTVLRSNELIVLPVFTLLFVIGRAAFALGYPNYRAYGFAMNLVSTVLVTILISYRLLIEGTLFQYLKRK